jgi:FtsP/CotA-like multicopper oxidase with cupredoxin domain
MSMEDHPMHLHGHSFQIVGINGRSVNGPVKDTITIHPMEQYDVEFVANNPGTWLVPLPQLGAHDGWIDDGGALFILTFVSG